MKISSKILTACAALLLLAVFVLPIWEIDLKAPQYPEGLGLNIWVNKITGSQSEFDLDNLNRLNHYIGMKEITPDSIPELKFMPPIIIALSLLGLLVALIGKRALLGAWLALLTLASVGGLVDFYLWEYGYGHNLNPHAAIIVPGMSYQPPFIGTEQLLNITATSLPASGGIVVGVGVLLGFVAFFLGKKKSSDGVPNNANKTSLPAGIIAFAALSLAGTLSACKPSTEPIAFGKDRCDHCKMQISDKKFGAELVTTKSKIYKFDALECMAGFVNNKTVPESDIYSLWVIDFSHPEQLVDARTAVYLHSKELRSPMGMNLSGFQSASDFEAVKKTYQGEQMAWNDVLTLVQKEWSKK